VTYRIYINSETRNALSVPRRTPDMSSITFEGLYD